MCSMLIVWPSPPWAAVDLGVSDTFGRRVALAGTLRPVAWDVPVSWEEVAPPAIPVGRVCSFPQIFKDLRFPKTESQWLKEWSDLAGGAVGEKASGRAGPRGTFWKSESPSRVKRTNYFVTLQIS